MVQEPPLYPCRGCWVVSGAGASPQGVVLFSSGQLGPGPLLNSPIVTSRHQNCTNDEFLLDWAAGDNMWVGCGSQVR